MADPATMMMLAGLGSSLIGGKQVGGMAPAPNLGVPGGGVSGQTGREGIFELLERLRVPNPTDPLARSLAGLIDPVKSKAAAPLNVMQDTTPEALGGKPQETVKAIQDTSRLRPLSLFGRFDNFFGNLDQNLESPSRILALGLLNQLDPRLGLAGLAAGGLFGKGRVLG